LTFGRLRDLGARGGTNYPFLTSKERDNETGLDYFINRYYSSTQGRFTSVDPTLQSIDPTNPQTLNRYTYALNNPLAFIDPDGLDPLFIGSYDKLTDEQKRLFETYVQQNYAEELKNPLFSAESLWNGSAAVANGDAAAGPNSRLLDDGQLTNFLGVTNMLQKRGVIDQVASISEIHGDAPEGHTYRIIGELKNNSSAVEAIKKAFPNSITVRGMVNTRKVLVNRDYSVLRTAKFRVCLRRLASMSMSTIDAYFSRTQIERWARL
jgi:RHS repeat-associated protein